MDGGGAQDVYAGEERDGARLSWNLWPSNRLEATRIVVPVGCMYTPLKKWSNMPILPYDPIRCSGCGSTLNPYCQVDFRTKLWVCPFCLTRNHFPPHYAENISESNLPAELISQFTTVEYELQTAVPHGPPIFLFCVDTCVDEEEMDELKDSLQQTLNLIPDDSLVGLITFGTHVMVHELGFTECPKSYVFRGTKEYPPQRVQDLLGIAPPGRMGVTAQQAAMAGREPALGKFLLPLSECTFNLEAILEDLQRDPWPVPGDQRVQRCTGVAMSVAVGLLESSFPRQGARIMLFAGGPPTVGPGMVVAREKTQPMRSHTDLEKNKAPLHKDAVKYFQGIAERAVAACHVVDIFACSLDQVGLLEMKVCAERTGGLIVLADSFSQSVFKESLRRVFRRYPDELPTDGGQLQMGFAATLEVTTSREFKIAGAIGPCSSLKKTGPNVAETEIGVGGTSAWSMGGIDPSTTVAVYFEVTNSSQNPLPAHKRRFIQFITTYQHANGKTRLRSTTLCGGWHSDPADSSPIGRSFDQEAAAVLMARVAVFRTSTEEVADILRWVDRSLIRLCAKFADYRKDEPNSFRLPPEFSIYPQFMFHLRRSQFLQLFNTSPDEAAYYRSVLMRETTTNSLVMIQPSLLSYSFNGPPQPAFLDIASVNADTILLLDTFFHVIVFHGERVAMWREQGYQNHDEHKHFRELLLAPQTDAQRIMDQRLPVPRFIMCDQHKSESRFVIAKLNPSVTHNSSDGSSAERIFTDDVSLRVFMEHLMKLAVQS
uniref:Protein transport protein SEC23 n=1 Tax=Rhizochromulina marina TaxID=1034831 RepID=A0A7S2W7G0_9STRA|mmetsp:Transcript_16275/g.47753  ORF Transcript_16275/g.47753 Transcript_16275/m.47753 type:complete len:770 (+) Transcript_16275:71-2380(+)